MGRQPHETQIRTQACTRDHVSSVKLLISMFKQNELSNTAAFVVGAGSDTTQRKDANAKGNIFVYHNMFNNNHRGLDLCKAPAQCFQCPTND